MSEQSKWFTYFTDDFQCVRTAYWGYVWQQILGVDSFQNMIFI